MVSELAPSAPCDVGCHVLCCCDCTCDCHDEQ